MAEDYDKFAIINRKSKSRIEKKLYTYFLLKSFLEEIWPVVDAIQAVSNLEIKQISILGDWTEDDCSAGKTIGPSSRFTLAIFTRA